MVGMEIFGDLISSQSSNVNCNNPDLTGSYFAGFIIFKILKVVLS